MLQIRDSAGTTSGGGVDGAALAPRQITFKTSSKSHNDYDEYVINVIGHGGVTFSARHSTLRPVLTKFQAYLNKMDAFDSKSGIMQNCERFTDRWLPNSPIVGLQNWFAKLKSVRLNSLQSMLGLVQKNQPLAKKFIQLMKDGLPG